MSSREDQKKKSKHRYPDQLVKELLGSAKWKASKQKNAPEDEPESEEWDTTGDRQCYQDLGAAVQNEHIYCNTSQPIKQDPIYYNYNYPLQATHLKTTENTYAVPGETLSPYIDHWKTRSRDPSPANDSPYYSPVSSRGSPYASSYYQDINAAARPTYNSERNGPRPVDSKYSYGRNSPRLAENKRSSGLNGPRIVDIKYTSGRDSPRSFDNKDSSGCNNQRVPGTKYPSGRNSPKVTYHTEFHVSDVEKFDAEAVKRQLEREKVQETYQNYTPKKKYTQSISEEIQYLCEEIQKSQAYWHAVIASLHQLQQRCYSMQETLAQSEASIRRLNVDDRRGSNLTIVRQLQETLQDLSVTMKRELHKTEEDREKMLQSSNKAERILVQYDEICELFHKMDQEKEKKVRKLEGKVASYAIEITRMEKVIEAKDKDLKLYREYAYQHKEEDETFQILKLQVQTYQEDFHREKELSKKLVNQNEQLMRSLRDEEVINRELTSQLQSLLNTKTAIPSSQVLQEASRNSVFHNDEADIEELTEGGIKCRRCRVWLPSTAAYEVHVKQNCLKKQHKAKGMSYRLTKSK